MLTDLSAWKSYETELMMAIDHHSSRLSARCEARIYKHRAMSKFLIALMMLDYRFRVPGDAASAGRKEAIIISKCRVAPTQNISARPTTLTILLRFLHDVQKMFSHPKTMGK